jgi:hypothetical protein
MALPTQTGFVSLPVSDLNVAHRINIDVLSAQSPLVTDLLIYKS